MGNVGVFLIFRSFISAGFSYAYSLSLFHVGFRRADHLVISPDGLGGGNKRGGEEKGDFISHLLEYNVQKQ